MVARAVLLRPKLIIADEPVSMVDASLRATILDELKTLNRELGISIVYITHDLTTAFQICDNIVILYRGTVVGGRLGGAGHRRRPSTPTRSCWCPRSRCPTSTRPGAATRSRVPRRPAGRDQAPAASSRRAARMSWTCAGQRCRRNIVPDSRAPRDLLPLSRRPGVAERRCRFGVPAARLPCRRHRLLISTRTHRGRP